MYLIGFNIFYLKLHWIPMTLLLCVKYFGLTYSIKFTQLFFTIWIKCYFIKFKINLCDPGSLVNVVTTLRERLRLRFCRRFYKIRIKYMQQTNKKYYSWKGTVSILNVLYTSSFKRKKRKKRSKILFFVLYTSGINRFLIFNVSDRFIFCGYMVSTPLMEIFPIIFHIFNINRNVKTAID